MVARNGVTAIAAIKGDGVYNTRGESVAADGVTAIAAIIDNGASTTMNCSEGIVLDGVIARPSHQGDIIKITAWLKYPKYPLCPRRHEVVARNGVIAITAIKGDVVCRLRLAEGVVVDGIIALAAIEGDGLSSRTRKGVVADGVITRTAHEDD